MEGRNMISRNGEAIPVRCRRVAAEMVALAAEVTRLSAPKGELLLDAGLNLLEWAKDFEAICSINNSEVP